MGVDVSGSFMSYWPGDSIAIRPRNDPAMVDVLLKRLEVDGAAVFSVATADDEEGGEGGGEGGEGAAAIKRLLPHLNWPCTLKEALTVRGRCCTCLATSRKPPLCVYTCSPTDATRTLPVGDAVQHSLKRLQRRCAGRVMQWHAACAALAASQRGFSAGFHQPCCGEHLSKSTG